MTARAKGLAYLAAGAVSVLEVRPGHLVRATVRGTAPEPYAVRWSPAGGWSCTCPASARWARVCSHLLAVRAVVATDLEQLEPDAGDDRSRGPPGAGEHFRP